MKVEKQPDLHVPIESVFHWKEKKQKPDQLGDQFSSWLVTCERVSVDLVEASDKCVHAKNNKGNENLPDENLK